MRNKKLNILFVCRYNNTRSQIAKELFKRFYKTKSVYVDSAGVIGAKPSKDLKKALNFIFNKHNLRYNKPKILTKELLFKQNIIILVAEDVPSSLFFPQKKQGIKVIKLNVKDGHRYREKNREERLERVYLDLELKIKNLVKRIK